MIEPTESESKAELDRFCDAMISIHGEIRAIADGRGGRAGQPAEERAAHREPVIGATTGRTPTPASRPPSRRPGSREHKFWPSVGRIDNVYGDRNLVCTCAPIEAYA